ADVFSLFHFAHNEGLAVAVRHVRAKNHVVLADEIDDLRQQDIIGLGAEKEIAFAHVVHRRQIVPRSGLRMERGQLIARAPEAMVHPLKDEMDPLTARFEKRYAQIRKAVQYATADQSNHAHHYRDQKSDDSGWKNVTVNIVKSRTTPPDMNGKGKVSLCKGLENRQQRRVIKGQISRRAKHHHRSRSQ